MGLGLKISVDLLDETKNIGVVESVGKDFSLHLHLQLFRH